MRRITYIVFIGVIILTALPAFAASITLEWKEVRGSRGYIIEYRARSSSRTSRKRVSENRATLKLPPSTYRVRVAGLNKFGKPGVWSDWLRVSVASTSRGVVRLGARTDKPSTDVATGSNLPVAMLSRRRAPPRRRVVEPARKASTVPEKRLAAKASYKKEKLKKKVAKAKLRPSEKIENSNTYGFWNPSTLLAGLPQMQRGDTGLGMVYMGLAGSLAGYVVARGAAADTIAARPANNPLLMSLLLAGQSRETILVARELRADAQAEYQARIHGRRLAAGLLALVYIWHFVDVAFWSPPPAISAAAEKSGTGTYGVNILTQDDGRGTTDNRAEFHFSLRY